MIKQYIKEIIQAGKFLEENPDWYPDDEALARELEKYEPSKSIGYIVQMLSGPDW
jgi:hypothetical protein